MISDLKSKWENTIKKAEICKKRYDENKAGLDSRINGSQKVKVFKDLSLKEQKYIFDNIDLYKDLTKGYTDAYEKTKDPQYLHAIFWASKEAAFAYILASKVTDDEINCLKWNAEGK